MARDQRRFPQASPANTLRALLRLIDTPEEAVFSQDWLRQAGIGQSGQALALLNALSLLNSDQRLATDVQQKRRNDEEFAQLLLERVRSVCLKAGCTKEEIAFLGCEQLNKQELRERLGALRPLTEHSGASKTNAVSCLQTLHNVIANGASREYIATCVAQRTRSASGERAFPAVSSTRDSVSVVRGVRAPSNGSVVRIKQWLESPETSDAEGRIREFAIDYDHNEPISVAVLFDIPPTADHWLRLAAIAQREAESCAQVQESI